MKNDITGSESTVQNDGYIAVNTSIDLMILYRNRNQKYYLIMINAVALYPRSLILVKECFITDF